MAKPKEEGEGGLLDELVHQFSDPFAFFRELIQNGIDAGSNRIEVTLRHAPSAKKGVTSATVQDFGEGMSRKTIEDYLLTKFRSSKENDLTKIGKFGIGFMSVFSPAPELVVVETGKDGEYFRLLLHPDHSYELLSQAEPTEGTSVTLHKEHSASEYSAFADKSLAAVKKWCRHSEVEILFSAGPSSGGEPPAPERIREDVTVDAPFVVEHREEGTLIVAGVSRRKPPVASFYNRGLTLYETDASETLVEGVTFKILSRWLEHTLTRDNVRRDKHFDKAMGLVKALVEGKLRGELPAAIAKAATKPDLTDWRLLFTYAASNLSHDQLSLPSAQGHAVSLDRVRKSAKAARAILVAEGPSPLGDALEKAGFVALRLSSEDECANLVRSLVRVDAFIPAAEAFTLAREVASSDAERLLERALLPLLKAAGARAKTVKVASVEGEGSDALSVSVEALGVPQPMGKALLPPADPDVPPLLCLRREHDEVVSAISLAKESPRLAALLLCRHLLAEHGGLTEEADALLTEKALEG